MSMKEDNNDAAILNMDLADDTECSWCCLSNCECFYIILLYTAIIATLRKLLEDDESLQERTPPPPSPENDPDCVPFHRNGFNDTEYTSEWVISPFGAIGEPRRGPHGRQA